MCLPAVPWLAKYDCAGRLFRGYSLATTEPSLYLGDLHNSDRRCSQMYAESKLRPAAIRCHSSACCHSYIVCCLDFDDVTCARVI